MKNSPNTSESTITADKLLISQSANMRSSWGNSNQDDWGLLTYIAICFGVRKLEQNKFTTISELWNFLADYRQVIGTILDHENSCGILRTSPSITPINLHPDSGFRDQFEEFSSQYEYLQKASQENIHVVTDMNSITLTATARVNNKPLNYNRTSIFKIADEYKLSHTWDMGFIIELKLADNAFCTLKNDPSLSISEKETLIRSILFYLSDAMPCDRGSAAVAQSTFHVLEKYFIGKFTYFGRTDSAHGKTRGLQYDIAAMISPTFEIFEEYITQYILAPNIKIIDLPPLEILKSISSAAILPKELLQDKIKKHIDDLNSYLLYFKKPFIGIVDRKRKEKISRFVEIIQLINSLQEDIDNNDKESNLLIQCTIELLLNRIVQDTIFYPHFCLTLAHNQTMWPSPRAVQSLDEIQTVRDHALVSFYNSILSMHNFLAIIGQLMGRDTSDYWCAHSTCKKIMDISNNFNDLKYNGKEDLNNIIGIIHDAIKFTQRELNSAISLYFKFLQDVRKLKESKHFPEILDKEINSIVSQYGPADNLSTTILPLSNKEQELVTQTKQLITELKDYLQSLKQDKLNHIQDVEKTLNQLESENLYEEAASPSYYKEQLKSFIKITYDNIEIIEQNIQMSYLLWQLVYSEVSIGFGVSKSYTPNHIHKSNIKPESNAGQKNVVLTQCEQAINQKFSLRDTL